MKLRDENTMELGFRKRVQNSEQWQRDTIMSKYKDLRNWCSCLKIVRGWTNWKSVSVSGSSRAPRLQECPLPPDLEKRAHGESQLRYSQLDQKLLETWTGRHLDANLMNCWRLRMGMPESRNCSLREIPTLS